VEHRTNHLKFGGLEGGPGRVSSISVVEFRGLLVVDGREGDCGIMISKLEGLGLNVRERANGTEVFSKLADFGKDGLEVEVHHCPATVSEDSKVETSSVMVRMRMRTTTYRDVSNFNQPMRQ
jgi:hypothetical protein